MSTPRRINPGDTDIAPGWPRPFYRKDDEIEYVQWITNKAEDQIMSCDVDKTYSSGLNHLCTSCGEKMERGLIFDREWINNESRRPSDWGLDNVSGRLGIYDTHYGGSICYRCALFALKHCPMFSTFTKYFGDDLVWFVTTSPEDTVEVDDTTALEIANESLMKITTADIRKSVSAGDLYLTKVDNLSDLQNTVRPDRYYIRGYDEEE